MRSILTALQEGRLFELPEGATKDRALQFLARILDANPDIEVGTDAIEEIQRREQECNTGIGTGIAVPHFRAKREDGELYCAIGWSAAGIDYGAADGGRVHLIVMYYIPGAQKNVYLKEVSMLVKAMKRLGGIDPIAKAADLNMVRNLLLDWISSVAGETGPEAVARMIRLEIKQAQAVAAPAAPALAAAGERIGAALAFSVVVVPGRGSFVLASDQQITTALEGENGLAERLAAGNFTAAGRHIFVLTSTAYPDGRLLYQCAAIPGAK
jgi:mannitol/fructose-specific phosphotransferase system IIA component (Ntr-type)